MHEAYFNDPYYLAMVWYLLPLYLDIIRKGFTIMKSDIDISYAGKNIWKKYELMAENTKADIIFMREHPANTGHFYAIPNDRVIAFFEEWVDSQDSFKNLNDQQALAHLNGKIYMICNSADSCNHVKTLPMNRLRGNNTSSKIAAVSTYPSSFTRFSGICPPDKAINPCDEDVLYVHTICMSGFLTKMNKLKQLGFWLMEDICTETKLDISLQSSKVISVSVTRCVPIPRLSLAVENTFLHCKASI
ncbi:unnamed protein product [Adineta steineri]|uniref:Nucleotide-diphospho-sugar transferase domain-containing protein n=1 Tax=Adineta steineri TaxID=433720 RepID=A0A820A2M7_9BILA|nr:unnamed protein product [Adineta steineri]